MDRVRRGALSATAALVAVGLAGCGMVDDYRYPYAKESAETIFLDAMEATMAAESLRVSGTLDFKDEPAVTFNVMSDAKDRCSGEMSISSADFELVTTPEGDYLKGSSSSWEMVPGTGNAVAGRVLEDRWVKLERTDRAGFTFLCGLARKMLSPEQKKKADGGEVPDDVHVTHEGLSEAAGQKAVRLHFSDDKAAADVWVALDEPHYVLKLAQKSARSKAEVVLSDFGFPVEVSVPQGKGIFDIAKFKARSG